MSRPKRTLANAASIFAPVEDFNPEPTIWKDIENAFGKPLRASGRYHLANITLLYMSRRARELNPPLMNDALAQIERIETAARDFEAALQALVIDPVSFRLPGMFFAARSLADRIDDRFVADVSPEMMLRMAGSFARAAPRVRQMLEIDLKGRSDDTAWTWFVLTLREFVISRGLTATARGDTDSYGKASPFVTLVWTIQTNISDKYRLYNESIGGMSKAVSEALRRRPS